MRMFLRSLSVAFTIVISLAAACSTPSNDAGSSGAGGSSPTDGGETGNSGGSPTSGEGGGPRGGEPSSTGGTSTEGMGGDAGSALGGASGAGEAGAGGAQHDGGTTASGGTTDPVESGGSSGIAGAAGAGATNSGPNASDELYDPERLPRFDIELPQASIDDLNRVGSNVDPRQDTYVSATLHYGSETVSNIGIRIKGETSFQKLDRKPPFKLKFDAFVNKQEFRGLRRMVLNNLFEDPSFIAERLAYEVYRAAGVPAPRCNNALVYINGVFYGVYANVEAEDKTFLKRWFPTDGGNLYEEGGRDFAAGAEASFNLETNEAANDRTDLTKLIAALTAATNPDTFLTDVGGSLDIDEFLKFSAVEAAVNQWDMYSYSMFYINNLRLYDDPTSQKFHFIPWGHDLAMKSFRDSGKPYLHLFELSHVGDRPEGAVSSGLIFQRCLSSEPCKAAYRDAVRQVMAVYEALDLEAAATRYHDQIQEYVHLDTRKNVCCRTPYTLTDEQVEAAYQNVIDTIHGRLAALSADLEGG